MMMQPPSSTPTCPIFPYTTLFRSGSWKIWIAPIGGQRVAVDFRFEPGVIGDGLQFGRKDQRASGPAIIERFLADPVADKMQAVVPPIPQREGIHARDPGKGIFKPKIGRAHV